ncbi:MAG TPA: hypothetical protein VGP94_09730 [Tepidisphaeraceae bacterium]|nr:hypothetical protein [Tepidisphaeraceae bacterium]
MNKSLLLFLLLLCSCRATDPNSLSFSIVDQHPSPLISRSTPGAQDNKYGFEGGRVVLLDGIYHLFISEMNADPKWTKTRLAHWTSTDGFNFTRQSTLFDSSGDFTGADPRAALFLPMPVFDEELKRWTLFYSAFRSAPNQKDRWLINHDGRIYRALSQTAGRNGIGGPYKDIDIALQPDKNSDPWEGLQGVDSFFPFKIGHRNWLSFYGSAQTQKVPTTYWAVGLASAPSLTGPWTRLSRINPILYPRAENPHVVQLKKNLYAAIYDAIFETAPDSLKVPYTFSTDGLQWSETKYIQLSPGENNWIKQVRTPLSLIPIEHNTFLVYFTAAQPNGYSSLGRLMLKLRSN